MKRINLKPSVVKSIFEIIGFNADIEGGLDNDNLRYYNDVELSKGSLQDCMITNIQRVCKAIVGSDEGRIMKGMDITKDSSGLIVTITPGIAFTKNGNVIVFNSHLDINTSAWSSSYFLKIYAKHNIGSVKTTDGGVNTTFIKGKTRSENIVFDEASSPLASLIPVDYDKYVYVVADSDVPPEGDYAYIGIYYLSDKTAINGSNRGFGPNDNSLLMEGSTVIENKMQVVKGIHSLDYSKVDGSLQLNCNIIVNSYDGSQKYGQDISVNVAKPDGGQTTLVFQKGILVEVV